MYTTNAPSPVLATSTAEAIAPARFPLRLADGRKTSVSIPRPLVDKYIEVAGSTDAFRALLKEMGRTASPSAIYSRSMLIRQRIEERLEL